MPSKRRPPPPPAYDEAHASMLGIRIPEDLHVDLRILAARRRSNIRDVVMDMIRREVTLADQIERSHPYTDKP